MFRILRTTKSIAGFAELACLITLFGIAFGFVPKKAIAASPQGYILASIPNFNETFVKRSLQYSFIVNPKFHSQDAQFATDLFWLADLFAARNINAVSVMEEGKISKDAALGGIRLIPNSMSSVVLLPVALPVAEICNAMSKKTRVLFLLPAGQSGENLDEVLAKECFSPNIAFIAVLNDTESELMPGSSYGQNVAFAAKSTLGTEPNPRAVAAPSVSLMCAFTAAVATARSLHGQASGQEISKSLGEKLSRIPALEGLTRAGAALQNCQ